MFVPPPELLRSDAALQPASGAVLEPSTPDNANRKQAWTSPGESSTDDSGQQVDGRSAAVIGEGMWNIGDQKTPLLGEDLTVLLSLGAN